MNKKVREYLEHYCKSCGFTEVDDDAILEVLREGRQLYRKEISQHRWWNEYFYVAEIFGPDYDRMFIGYVYAEANREESVSELGYIFDTSKICEVRPVKKTIIIYEPVE